MSKTVDQRVVEMRFDNKQFEANAQTSIQTLESLKKSLDLTGAAKGLENVGAASKKIDFSVLSNSVEAVKERFSAMEVIAVTALANITNSAVNAGRQILYSLTTAPIKEGFGEYELKMGSIQTMMMSTGESLETVNQYLDELNVYADKTIYSFSDMTSNIGKFTNAGVKLKDAVKAIQGISNVAAISGANTNEASRAMYNFAQALSAGSVKLIDWKSIENANMATVDFKNQLLATALELGTVVKQGERYVTTTTNINGKTSDAFDATYLFNESLNHQWMTTEVLVKTLGRYSDETTEIGKKAFAAAQDVKTFTQLMDTLKEAVGSGWAMTWEIVFGDFEEAKKLWTSVSNVVGGFIDKMSDARNNLLKGWKELGGRADLIEAIKNAFSGLKSIVMPAVEVFQEFFPAIQPQKLADMSKALKDLTAKFKMSKATTENLKDTFRGLFAVVDILRNLFGAVFRSLKPVIDAIGSQSGGLIGKILGVTGAFGRWLNSLNDIIKKHDAFYNSIQLAIQYIKKGIEYVKKFAETIRKQLNLPQLPNVGEKFSGFIGTLQNKLKDFGEKSLKGIDTFFARLSGTLNQDIETKGIDTVNEKLTTTEDFMTKVLRALENMKNSIISAFEKVKNYLSQSKLFQFLKALWGFITRIASGIGKVLGESLSNLTKKLQNADFDQFLAFINTLSIGGIALGIRKFLKDLLSGIGNFKKIVKGVVSVLDGVRGCLDAYQTQLKADVLMKLAIAIGILAASLVVLSLIDSEKLNKSLGAVTVMFADLMGSFAIFSKTSGKMSGGAKAANVMLTMSFSVLILAAACKKLSGLDPQQIGAGVSGLTVLMYVLSDFTKKLGSSGKLLKSSIALIAIATSLKILVSACKGLAYLSWEELGRGVAGMSVLLYVLSDFTKKLGKSGKIMAASIALIAVGTGMKILVSACKSLAQLSWDELGRGVSGLSILMYVLADFTKKLGKSGKIMAASLSLIAIGAGMKIIVSACRGLSQLSWEELAKGVAGMTVLLYVLSDFTKKLGKSGKIMAASLSLIAIGAAMKILVSACASLAQLSIEELIKGLVGVGALLMEVALYAKMTNKSGNILQSSVALIAIGAALNILAAACRNFGEMDWESIGKSLLSIGALLLEVGIFSKMTSNSKNIIASGVALITMSVGLKIFASVCKDISQLNWGDIAKGLITIAGAFVIIGVAGKVLGPIVPSILGLAGSLALFGVGFAAIGAGLMLIGAGLTSISVGLISLATTLSVGATEITAALAVIIAGVAEMIPFICKKIGEGVVALCVAVYESLPELSKVLGAIVQALINILVDYAPNLVEGVLVFLDKTFDLLLRHGPDLVSKFIKLFEVAIRAIEKQLPGLVDAFVSILLTFFASVFDALNNADNGLLMRALQGIGIFAEILLALAALGFLAGAAMAGVLAVGLLMAELSAVLTAIGMLEQIPGLNWLIGEGGKLLEAVGGAIGNFIGGLVGGAMESISNKLPKIGNNLAEFFDNAKPFIEGIGKLKASSLDGVKALAGIVLTLTATDILDGLTSWFTGGSSLVNFGKELAEFGPSLSAYYESIQNVKDDVVTASANAALSLAELAKKLPERNGLMQWFFGQTTLTDFAKELEDFGPAMAKYSEAVKDVKPEVVTASADAAMALAKLAQNLPDHGGVLQWFTGDATLTTFAKEIEAFGPSIGKYSEAVKDVKPEVVEASAYAAQTLANLADNLPEHGGIEQWFTGDATLTTFAKELEDFGPAIAKYSDSVAEIDEGKITTSANAASILSQTAANLPKHDGLMQIFTGDATLSSFAKELKDFGPAIAEYSKSVEGINEEKVDASANAALVLAKANDALPESGGLKQIWTGNKDLSAFAEQLKPLGKAIKEFSDEIEGITSDNVDTAVYAIRVIAEANENIPESGGIKQVFTGEKSLITFAEGLKEVGPSIKEFSDSVTGIKEDKITASSNAIKVLAEANKAIPESGGFKQFWTGEQSLKKFAEELIPLASSVKNFGDRIQNIDPDLASKAADFLKTLAEVNNALPNVGGIVSWYSGNKQSLGDFGNGLAGLADGVALFYAHLYGVDTVKFEKIIDSVSKLVEFGVDLSEIDVDIYSKFGNSLSKMATDGITSFTSVFDNAKGEIQRVAYQFIDTFTRALTSSTVRFGDLSMAMNTLIYFMDDELTDSQDNWEKQGRAVIISFKTGISSQSHSVGNVLRDTVKQLQSQLKEAEPSFISSGSSMMTYLSNGMKQKQAEINRLAETIVTIWLIPPIKGKYRDMQSIGSYMMDGFARGISERGTGVTDAAVNVANAAAQAIRKTLLISSPSKVTYQLGDYFGMGFANAILDNQNASYDAGLAVADSAKKGLSQAIQRVRDYIDGNVDTDVTIRPVLDMSALKNDVDRMNGMLSAQKSLSMAKETGLTVNMSSLSARELKVNNNDVVQEITALRKEVAVLQETIHGMRVVMDTGALVGSIAAPMNQALGRQAIYDRRRN